MQQIVNLDIKLAKKKKLPGIDKKIFPYDLVIAWWEDIVADSIWVDIPDIKKSTTAVCCTVGWLMKQDSDVTILMSDFNFESNNDIKQGGGHTTIPTKNILKIKKIKIQERAMEAKFDPKAKVKQGQLSDAPEGNSLTGSILILIFLNIRTENKNLLSTM